MNKSLYYYTITTSINSDGMYKPCISIYFSGCDKTNKCKNCHNKELQKPFSGYGGNINKLKEELMRQIKSFKVLYGDLRVAFVGGEPLAKYNREAVFEVSEFLKSKYDCTTILYTWRTIQDIYVEEIFENLKYIDYGILGEFDEDKFVKNQIPASTNQYIYDFKKNKKIKPIKKENDIYD